MSRKKAIWTGMIIGSIIGQFIPSLWDSGMFSFSSVILSAIFASCGIWIGYKIS